MAKSDRMFEIIQLLRNSKRPVKAEHLADQLEVSKRTIYRDIATLQSMRTPIEGEAGIGYVMRKGYDLPPLAFNEEEAEAITIGLAMIGRTGDAALLRAARRAAAKLSEAIPAVNYLHSSEWGVEEITNLDPAQIRLAIRKEQKLHIVYGDASDEWTMRTILPLAVFYYAESAVLAAWCELRTDFRHFRLDRMADMQLLDEYFPGEGENLRQRWEEARGLQG